MSTTEKQTSVGPLPPDTVRIGGQDVPIATAGLTVGRGAECDITLDTRRASRRHARIYLDGDGCWVQDLESTNGTFVNEQRIGQGPQRLNSGDRIRIGEQELLVLAGEKTEYERSGEPARRAAHTPLRPLALTREPLTIGRDQANVLVLDDPNVSRFHAVISPAADGFELRDLSSRNGTRIDGELVGRVRLHPGVEIAVGAYRLTFTGERLIPRDERGALRLESRTLTVAVGSLTLLTPTSLIVEPGELVAIIGESGAGKTTLLKALAGITRPSAGQVLLGGEPVAARLTDVGYVPQDDIVHRLLTVREALSYAAQLRLPPDTSEREIADAVQRVLAELDLEPHADTLVRNISGGQRKRVGVAVELLSRPGILFLDEPATGLDPGLEKRLMELLHSLSRDSRPVVAITHSTKHLHLCDELAVMARGGVLVFYGPPPEALEFFGVGEYDDIYTALDEHPVDHWLKGSPPEAPSDGPAGLLDRPARDRQPPVVPQAIVLERRYARLLLRDRRNLAILLGQAPLLALLIAIGFKRTLLAPGGSRIDGPTFLFVTAITALWLGSIASAREIVKERSVFLRERAVGVSVSAYVLSKVLVLLVLCAVQTGILALVLFALRPLYTGASGYAVVFGLLLLTSLTAIGMGLFISSLARSEDQSASFIPLLLIPLLLFGGSLIPLVHKGFGIRLLSGLMVSRWSFAGLGAAVHLGNSPAVVHHYGTIFSHPPGLMIAIVALFAAAFLGAVVLRLQLQRD